MAEGKARWLSGGYAGDRAAASREAGGEVLPYDPSVLARMQAS